MDIQALEHELKMAEDDGKVGFRFDVYHTYDEVRGTLSLKKRRPNIQDEIQLKWFSI